MSSRLLARAARPWVLFDVCQDKHFGLVEHSDQLPEKALWPAADLLEQAFYVRPAAL